MHIEKIAREINCEILTEVFHKNKSFTKAFGSDLMSDVLAFIKDDSTILITGLCNQQVIRTAEMIELKLIIFVRDKKPSKDIIELAEKNKITLLSTNISLFDASGILYHRGIRGINL